MFKNYFNVMIRGLLKRKAFTLINLIGLAAGMAICLLLALYIQNELGYDLYQERGDHIYRLDSERKYPGRSTFFSAIPLSVGQAVRKEFPEVLESTRVFVFDDGQNGRDATIAVFDRLVLFLLAFAFFAFFAFCIMVLNSANSSSFQGFDCIVRSMFLGSLISPIYYVLKYR
jgi:putative ABC transport system permease protein